LLHYKNGVLVKAGMALHKLTSGQEEAEQLGEIKPSGWCLPVFIRGVRDNKSLAFDPITRL
jgi:hypothetical protein